MIRHELTFTRDELARIAAMCGEEWRAWGASQSTPIGDFAVEKVFIRTSRSSLTIRGRLIEMPIGTYVEELVALTVEDDPEEEHLASNRGRIYFQNRGEPITSISIVRDVIDRTTDTAPDWSLTADRGLVFEFESDRLAITAGSDFSADFIIQRSPLDETLELPDTSYYWESTLEERFDFHRSVIPIRALIEDP